MKMKRYIFLLLILALILSLASCGKSDFGDVDSGDSTSFTEEDVVEGTLEDNLHKLKKAGWKKSGDEYIFTDKNEACEYTFVMSAKGDVAKLEMTYEYGDNNKPMADLLSEDEAAVKGMVGYWYIAAANAVGNNKGSVEYVFNIGSTKVGSGTLSYDEAEECYNNYYEE